VVLDTRTEMLHGLSEEQQKSLSVMLQTVKSNLLAELEMDRSQLHDQRLEDGTS
jgi:hypothetical protein